MGGERNAPDCQHAHTEGSHLSGIMMYNEDAELAGVSCDIPLGGVMRSWPALAAIFRWEGYRKTEKTLASNASKCFE